MSKKKSKQKDLMKGTKENEFGEVVAEDGGEMTEELQEIYDYDEEEKQQQITEDTAVNRTPMPLEGNRAVIADVLEVPKFCANCYLQDKCGHFDEEATCRYRTEITIGGAKDILELIKMIIEIQGERIVFGRFIEAMEGGYVDRNLSEEIKRLMEMVKMLKEINQDEESISIHVKGQKAVEQSSKGILSEIFGGGNKNKEE